MRHGESTANADGILSGWLNVPLTAVGIQQARTVGLKLCGYPIQAAWSSDLQRAISTAELALDVYAKNTGTKLSVQCSDAFRERNFGILQGRLKKELQQDGLSESLHAWKPLLEGLEGFQDLAQRVLPQMDYCTQYEHQILFAHGGVIRLLHGLLLGLPPEKIAAYHIDNATPIVVDSPQDGWSSLLPSSSRVDS